MTTWIPTNLKEPVWAFATRCHPLLRHAIFDHSTAAPLLAYLRRGEKASAETGKIVYNSCRPTSGARLPTRASFRHGYKSDIVQRVENRWLEYGFR
ncbi:MAG: hypothetical protein WDN04_11290 [Rhodospirillales bacterium]